MHQSWLPVALDSDFSIHNLPFGIFSDLRGRRAGVAIGDFVIDLAEAYDLGMFPEYKLKENVFRKPVLNDAIKLGRAFSRYVRTVLQNALCTPYSSLHQHADSLLIRIQDVQMHLPLQIGNYTDFYSSEEHATTVGKLFRPDNPLFPNWKQMPVAYHGRASSIVVSGTPVHRPCGQMGTGDMPVFAPTKALDYELELAFVVGMDSELGKPIPVSCAEDYIFGVLLFNDWSARDIQRWEYQPLGPFTSKNFASSVSPWIVTMDALDAFRNDLAEQSPEPLPYLLHENRRGFDINLTIGISPAGREECEVAATNSRQLYWNISQQVAHHTVTGCNLNVGDLLATGTISGGSSPEKGCLLEATSGGKSPVSLKNGIQRTFLEDNDEVIMRGYAQKGDIRVGFGELRGKILPPVGR